MRKYLFATALLLTVQCLLAQTAAEYTQILTRYEQWKTTQYNAGTYAKPAQCKIEIVSKANYKGPMAGIPKDISIHYAEINGDNKLDALVTFHPMQCDGGNAMMNAQSRVLILSKGSTWITDDKFVDAVEGKRDGWLSVSGVSDGTIHGTYYEYGPDDGRCCPSIKKPFTIDYITKKLTIDD